MINFLICLVLCFGGVVAVTHSPNLIGAMSCGAMWFSAGGLSTWEMIRVYRKALGYKPDPFEPENIYMS